MPSSHAKQKQALKHKKKREAASQKARETTRLALRPTPGDLVRMAAGRPLGPAFVSEGWDVLDEALPQLVSVVVTRRGPGQILIGSLALVDRTCLGVKNAVVFPPQTDLELEERIAMIGDQIGPLRRVEPIIAQSVVYNAIEYARALGFAPHRDFPEAIFGPRPATLVDTPLSRVARPFYVSGPDDDMKRILGKLITAVGPDGFDITVGGPPVDELDEDEDEDVAGMPQLP